MSDSNQPEQQNADTIYEFKLDETLKDKRLDCVLAALCPELSRTLIQKLIRDSRVTINGVTCRIPRTLCAACDAVVLREPPPEIPDRAAGEKIPLDVLYEDTDLLIINKPAGMVVHPAAGNWHGTVVNAVLGRVPDFDDEDFDPIRPGIVHRLDKDTSGVLVIAKNAKTLRRLARSFSERQVHKTYLAIVHGWPSPDVNVVNMPVGRHPTNRQRMTVVRPGMGREAVTTWRVIQKGFWNGQRASVLEVSPHTGRTHQIRVHLSHKDYPIMGDKLYARGRSSSAQRQMLHARRIEFPNPETGETMRFEAPVPDDFMSIVNDFRDAD